MQGRNQRVQLQPCRPGRECLSHFLAGALTLLVATSALLAQQQTPAWPSRDAQRMSVQRARSAAASNPTIQQYVRRGSDYFLGRGVPQNPVQAAYWYKKAADLGDPDAQNEMGYFCLHGIGLPQDGDQAAKWFMRSVGGGSQLAKLNLAVLYITGMGVKADPKLGLDLLTQLAEKGDAHAESFLGVLYLNGMGVAQDQALAEKWFSKAAKKKSPEGEYAMGRFFSNSPNHEHSFPKAAKFLRSAARAGFVPAISALGILLVHHPEVKRASADEGLTMLQRAAEAGRWESSETLAILARDGSAGHHDVGEAFRWFTIAARQGGPLAEKQMHADLAYCRAILPPDQQDLQTQMAEAWLAQHPEHDLYVLKTGLRIPVDGAWSGLPQ